MEFHFRILKTFSEIFLKELELRMQMILFT
jgi:hypothetical protein